MRMELKTLNYITAACFALSSASLLFIPVLNFENGFPTAAYLLAGLFWAALLAGAILQIILWRKTRRSTIVTPLKKPKMIVIYLFALSALAAVFVLALLRTSAAALPVTLFVMLLSIEALAVIKRMERLL